MFRSPRMDWYTSFVAAAALFGGLLSVTSASAAVASHENSIAIVNADAGTKATQDTRIIHPRELSQGAGSQVATIVLTLKDENGEIITDHRLTVTNSGAGLLGSGAGSPTEFVPTGHAISISVSQFVVDKYVVSIFGDGIGGFSAVTIYDGPTLISTKFVAFYGPVASITAIRNLHLPSAGGTPLGSSSARNLGDGTFANTPAIILSVKDANGIPVPNANATQFSAVSSDLTQMSSVIGVIQDDNLGAGSLGPGTYNVQVRAASGAISGKPATLIFRYSVDGVHFVTTLPVTFTASSPMIARVALAFDQKIYAPGDNATVTLIATDSSGNPVSGQDAMSFFATSEGLTTSAVITKSLFPTTTLSIIDGRAITSFDLPSADGSFTVTGRLGNGASLASAIQGTPISATITILTKQDVQFKVSQTSTDEAVKIAHQALDAVTAMSSTVTALAAMVRKIQKRLGIR